MKKEQVKKFKRLSESMEEELMEHHERKLLAVGLIPAYYSRYCKSLYSRGYLELKQFIKDDKSFYGFHITDKGISYLSTYITNKTIT